MKTFAFVSNNSLKTAYTSLLLKYRRQDTIWDVLKIIFLVLVFLVAAIFYLRYVSLSSTRGYFLRQENQNLNNVSFKYEILKTQLLEQKLKNRGVLNGDASEREMIVVPIDPVGSSGVQTPVITTTKID
ncbi:MAG: hypothetical protein WCO66_00110 [Candidatus Absconditabacteria bacterium]